MAPPSGRFRNFIHELKRRRVFRVASIYLVGAWVVVQVTTTVGPVLGLDWLAKGVVISALVGFPIALVLAWAFDVTSAGVERTDHHGKTTVRAPWMAPVLAITTGFLLLAAAYFAWVRITQPPTDDAPAIAVFPFTVQGGPGLAYLQEGMVHLLGTKLNGAGSLRSVDPNVLLNAVSEQMSQRKAKELPVETARSIAQRFGASAFIMGDVAAAGETLTLTGLLYRVDDPDAPPSQATVTGTEEELFAAIDRLAKALITSQYNVPATRLLRTAGLTTESLVAFKAYVNGEQEYRGARWRNAIDWFQRAIAADSTYALASYRLAAAGEWAADFDVVIPAAEQAFRNREKLSPRDRKLVEALHDWVNGRIEPAEKAYREFTAEYPEDAEAWYRLGEILYHYNPMRGRSSADARDPFLKAIALDPAQEPIVLHLMEIALARRQYATFDSLAKRINLEGGAALRRTAIRSFASNDRRAIDSVFKALQTASDGTLNIAAHGAARYMHDIDRAERVAAMMTDQVRPAPVRGAGYVLLAQLDIARGQWRSARQRLSELEKIHRPTALEYHALYASVPMFKAQPVEMRTLRNALEQWNATGEPGVDSYSAFLAVNNGAHTVLRSYAIGLLSANLGENEAAASQAVMLQQSADSGAVGKLAARLAAGVLAQNEMVQGNPAKALAALDGFNIDASLDLITNSPFYAHVHERFLQGELRFLNGNYREALPWYEAMIDGHNEIYLLGPSYLRRAQIYEKLDKPQLAQEFYRAFVELWADADPALRPVVDEARTRLSALTARK